MAKLELITNPSPAELGYSMPAEWEPHAATWLGWPHNESDWPDKIDTIRWVYGEMVRKITQGETVRLLVRSQAEAKFAASYLKRAHCDLKKVQFVVHPTNRGWTRDSGPIHVTRPAPRSAFRTPRSEKAIVHFHFNAWAKYRNWQLDTKVPETAAALLKRPLFDAQFNGKKFVIEGGGIEVNGRGTLLTTEECYQHPTIQVRNKGMTKAEYDAQFKKYLGVKNVLWLVAGPVGDDTHGHIDDICRFTDARTLVLIKETNKKDPNYQPLAENWERIQDLRLEDGSKPGSLRCRCPRRSTTRTGGCRRATRISTSRMPASSCRRSTTRTTVSRWAFLATCSRTAPSSASMPWIWCWALARCTA
jgi:agmatine deiminase